MKEFAFQGMPPIKGVEELGREKIGEDFRFIYYHVYLRGHIPFLGEKHNGWTGVETRMVYPERKVMYRER